MGLGRSGGVGGGHGDHPENRRMPTMQEAQDLQGHSYSGHSGQVMTASSGAFQQWGAAHRDVIGDVADSLKEKHEDNMRHLLLKRIPAFKQDWDPTVQVAWLEAITRMFERG